MPARAELLAQHARRVTAAVAFWIVAVLFVADVSLLSGWLRPGPASAQPAPSVEASSTPQATTTADPTPEATPSGSAEVPLDGGATVTFPQAPAPTEQLVDVGGEEVVLSLHSLTTADETTYSIGVIEYPDSVDLGDPAVNLLASVSGAAGNAAGRVVAQDVFVFEGAPAVQFEVETETVRLRARNVLAGRRMYSQTVAYAGDREPSDADAFFDSFTLEGP